MFAYNNEQIDYIRLALLAALMRKKTHDKQPGGLDD